MSIKRFEDIEAWRLARELTNKVYELTRKPLFVNDFSLKKQIQSAAASSMNNIAEGFDAESNVEFIRFLRYAKRSCSEVQSQLYIAQDQDYIDEGEFQNAYDKSARTRAAIHGFIRYLQQYESTESTKSKSKQALAANL